MPVAFHNDPKIQEKWSDRLNTLPTNYGTTGFPFWLIAELDWEAQMGIPIQLGYLLARQFCFASPNSKKLVNAVKLGADLSDVWNKFAIWLLTDLEEGVIRFVELPGSRTTIRYIAELFRAQCTDEQQWSNAQYEAAKYERGEIKFAAKTAMQAVVAAADSRITLLQGDMVASCDAAYRATVLAARADYGDKYCYDVSRIRESEVLIEILNACLVTDRGEVPTCPLQSSSSSESPHISDAQTDFQITINTLKQLEDMLEAEQPEQSEEKLTWALTALPGLKSECAITTTLGSRFWKAVERLGNCFAKLGRPDEACQCFHMAATMLFSESSSFDAETDESRKRIATQLQNLASAAPAI